MPFYYLWPDSMVIWRPMNLLEDIGHGINFAISPLGTPNVLSPAIIQPDYRFLNPFNFMIRYDNTPLTKTIQNYWDDETISDKNN